MFLDSLLQYDRDLDQFNANVRFNLIHRPLSDLFVVYNEQRSSSPARRARRRAVIVKFTRSVAFSPGLFMKEPAVFMKSPIWPCFNLRYEHQPERVPTSPSHHRAMGRQAVRGILTAPGRIIPSEASDGLV